MEVQYRVKIIILFGAIQRLQKKVTQCNSIENKEVILNFKSLHLSTHHASTTIPSHDNEEWGGEKIYPGPIEKRMLKLEDKSLMTFFVPKLKITLKNIQTCFYGKKVMKEVANIPEGSQVLSSHD